MKRTTVLVLRHGERADEIPSSHYRRPKPPRSERTANDHRHYMDPPLTVNGHSQAEAAWNAIVTALRGKKRKVMVAVSPLQRTIGTAMMVGASANRDSDDRIEFYIPGGTDQEEGSTSNVKCPVLVMNGLSDPAAYVQRAGGAYAAAQGGWLDCAATVDASADQPPNTNAFRSKLLEVLLTTQEGVSSTQLSEWGSTKVQFWKEDHYDGHQLSSSYTPLSHPFSATRDSSISTKRIPDVPVQPRIPVATSPMDDTYLATINRAVRLAQEGDCDVVVLVTHRESIRYMAYRLCGFQPTSRANTVSTPYCCIGTFEAVVRANQPARVEWRYHACTTLERFEEQSLPPFELQGNDLQNGD